MKKVFILGALVLAILLVASALSGCTTSTSNGTGTATAKPAGASAPAKTPALKTVFDYDKVKSCKVLSDSYMSDKLTATVNVTVTYTPETYNGVAARHVVMRVDSALGHTDYDYYYNVANRDLLVAHRVQYGTSGDVVSDLGLNDSLTRDSIRATDPSFYMEEGSDPSYRDFTKAGTDTVTVPMGTYTDCPRYEAQGLFTKGKYWMTGGVAIPIKIERVSGNKRETIEMVEYQAA